MNNPVSRALLDKASGKVYRMYCVEVDYETSRCLKGTLGVEAALDEATDVLGNPVTEPSSVTFLGQPVFKENVKAFESYIASRCSEKLAQNLLESLNMKDTRHWQLKPLKLSKKLAQCLSVLPQSVPEKTLVEFDQAESRSDAQVIQPASELHDGIYVNSDGSVGMYNPRYIIGGKAIPINYYTQDGNSAKGACAVFGFFGGKALSGTTINIKEVVELDRDGRVIEMRSNGVAIEILTCQADKQYPRPALRFDYKTTNSDGSISFVNPRYWIAGRALPLWGYDSSGKSETGACRVLGYQSGQFIKSAKNRAEPTVFLNADGSVGWIHVDDYALEILVCR